MHAAEWNSDSWCELVIDRGIQVQTGVKFEIFILNFLKEVEHSIIFLHAANAWKPVLSSNAVTNCIF